MPMSYVPNKKGLIPIIAIIAGLLALGGIGAVYLYVMSNQATLEPAVEEAREERAAEAQANGYPDLWAVAGLPEYPNGELTKTRQGRDLSEGAQVTVETSDAMATVTSFWDGEMASRGFTQSGFPGNEFATMVRYENGSKLMTLQFTKIGDGPNNKMLLIYRE